MRKHLCKRFGKKFRIKYFAAGEYGGNTARPHYHLLIYGYDFSDSLIPYSSSKSSIPMYLSSELDQC